MYKLLINGKIDKANKFSENEKQSKSYSENMPSQNHA
jgi:hypothetical protein